MRNHPFLTIALAAALFTASAFAATAGGGRPQRTPLQKVVVLHPDNADVKQPTVALYWSDGRRQVRTHPTAAPSVRQMTSLEWSVDLDRGTYANHFTQPSAEMLNAAAAMQQRHPQPVKALDIGCDYMLEGCDDPSGPVLFGYDTILDVEACDPPAAYNLVRCQNRTSLITSVSQCNTYTFEMEIFDGRCWADPQTFLNTHWFTDFCYTTPPPERVGGYLVGSVLGHYHNYDFGLNSRRTDVEVQETVIVSANVWPPHPIAYPSKSGEGSALLGFRSHFWQNRVLSLCQYAGGGSSGGGTPPSGGSGPAPGGGGNADWGCATVYDGLTHETLGVCCGTVEMIIECAISYL